MGSFDDRKTALEAELAQLDAAIAKALSAGQAAGADGLSVSRVSYAEMVKRRSQVVRSLQRLSYGGRMVVIGVNNATPNSIAQTGTQI